MEQERTCPLCGSELSKPRKQVGPTDAFSFDCPACGYFEVFGPLLAYWDVGELDEQDETLLSNLPDVVRRRNDAGRRVSLTFDNWRAIAGTE